MQGRICGRSRAGFRAGVGQDSGRVQGRIWGREQGRIQAGSRAGSKHAGPISTFSHRLSVPLRRQLCRHRHSPGNVLIPRSMGSFQESNFTPHRTSALLTHMHPGGKKPSAAI